MHSLLLSTVTPWALVLSGDSSGKYLHVGRSSLDQNQGPQGPLTQWTWPDGSKSGHDSGLWNGLSAVGLARLGGR